MIRPSTAVRHDDHGTSYGRDEDRPKGACADKVDDWLWFDHSPREEADALAEAKVICEPCPIRAACLAFAIKHKEPGIWAATTEDMRRGKKSGTRCRKNHDLTLPGARGYKGQCIACRNARDAKYAKEKAS